MTNSSNLSQRSAISTAATSKRRPTKRSVSFAKPSTHHMNDVALQSNDKRRRYNRRGSKTPAMLFLSKSDLSRIQELYFSSTGIMMDDVNGQTTTKSATGDSILTTNESTSNDFTITSSHDNIITSKQRRMSIVSSLRQSLEINCSLIAAAAVAASSSSSSRVSGESAVVVPTNVIRRRLSLDPATTIFSSH